MPAVPYEEAAGRAQAIKPDSQVYIMGWGSQNDADHGQPSTSPIILTTTTIACPNNENPAAPILTDVEAYEARYTRPVIICIGTGVPESEGAPCKGDAGGKDTLF